MPVEVKSRHIKFIGLTIILLMLFGDWRFCWRTVQQANTQDSITWSNAVNLSNSPSSSNYPEIVADNYGVVHVFWAEDYGGQSMEESNTPAIGNTIQYAQWIGGKWSFPNEILLVPDDFADFVRAEIDGNGFIHLVWVGQSNLYYSNAHASEAHIAPAWLNPIIIGTNSARHQWPINLFIDDDDVIHVLYATKGGNAGVYHASSPDGQEWKNISLLPFSPSSDVQAISNLMLIGDNKGILHAAWVTNNQEQSLAIYYSRSLDKGDSWEEIRVMKQAEGDEEWVTYPYLWATDDSKIHMIHTNGTNLYRSYRISDDSGKTWSDQKTILKDMAGINGYVFPLIDSLKSPHLIVNMRPTATQITGIYYAPPTAASWGLTVPVVANEPFTAQAHYTSGAISSGNEIHVVWSANDTREVWHVRGTVNDVLALPTIPAPEPMTTIADNSGIVEDVSQVSALSTPVPEPAYSDLDLEPPVINSLFSPILIGVLAALFSLTLIVLIKRMRR